MFGKPKSTIYINGNPYQVDQEVNDEIDRILSNNVDLSIKVDTLMKELDEITPIIKSSKLNPVISDSCRTCEFAVLSDKNRLLGCRKGVVCEDYKNKW